MKSIAVFVMCIVIACFGVVIGALWLINVVASAVAK